MDFFSLACYLKNKTKGKQETFDADSSMPAPTHPVDISHYETYNEEPSTLENHKMMIGPPSLIFSLLAAWLSWISSTIEGRPLPEKILWSFLAGLFGFSYIVYFYLFREPTLRLGMGPRLMMR